MFIEKLCARRLGSHSRDEYVHSRDLVMSVTEAQIGQSLMRRRGELVRDVFLTLRRSAKGAAIDEDAVKDVLRLLTSQGRLGALLSVSPYTGYFDEMLVHPTRLAQVTAIRNEIAARSAKQHVFSAKDIRSILGYNLSQREATAMLSHLVACNVGLVSDGELLLRR